MIFAFGLRLHHIGYAVAEIPPASALYTARFGYEIVSPVIHDPLQTAHVQFLRLPGDSSYLEFVAPDGPDSKLSAAVQKGGGLNHLCFHSGPLEAMIEHLEANGLLLISDPKPAVAFAGRRICWLMGRDRLPIELVERRSDSDLCEPGIDSAPGT